MIRKPGAVDKTGESDKVLDLVHLIHECSHLSAAPATTSELEDSAHSAARLLKLLASEQRLLILCKLIEQECSVGELSEHIRLTQSATSQHLARMRAEGLVDTRRDAQTIYYSLKDPAAIRIIRTLSEIYC
jgi:DNA-binding transcriptional ArsR family regulator